MNREQQEMTLWREAWLLGMKETTDYDGAIEAADAAVAEFRKRYSVEPTAPAPVWYDEPPRPGEYHVEGLPAVCWVDEDVVWCPDWDRANERPRILEMPRNGRRVCPIVKPPEPTT